MQTFFENIDAVLYSVDMLEYRVLQMSPACEKVFGYTVREMTENPMKWLEVVVEEDRHLIDACEVVMKRGEIAGNEHRIRHRDGSIRWVSDRLIPTLDENGQLVRIDGVASDITGRKEAEQALVQSEMKFRTLLENSSDGIIVTNAEGKLIFGSSSMLRITGYSGNSGEIDIPGLFHPDDQSKITAVRTELLENPGSFAKFVARFRRKDGSWMWMEGVSQNLFHDPAVNGILTNFRDVTDHVQYEANLRAANKDLKKTNEELDRFVYSVSHDLRAPLASLLGLLDYTEDLTALPEIRESLAMMRDSVKKLDGFVLDILDYSRNSRTELQVEAIDFEELIGETVSNVKYMSQEAKGVSIRWNVQGDQPFHSDATRLKIVIGNLLSNAIRYADSEKHEPFVSIEVLISEKEALMVVRDNGLGIDPKYHTKIFDMFFRLSSRSVGSGLGLYIVREAVDKIEGRIELISEPGMGTEFRLIIPNFAKS